MTARDRLVSKAVLTATALLAICFATVISGADDFELLDISVENGIGELRIKTYGHETKAYFESIRESSKYVPVHTLAFLRLESTDFFKYVPEFHTIATLSFSKCKLADISALLNRDDCIKALQRISIRDSYIEGDFLASSSSLKNLESLTVSACKLSDNAFQSLSDSSIKYLFCAHTDLNNTQLNHIAVSEQIVEATIQMPKLTKKQILQLSRMRKLKKLTLFSNENREEIKDLFFRLRPDIELSFLDRGPVTNR